jgi:hypothetical protein
VSELRKAIEDLENGINPTRNPNDVWEDDDQEEV